MQVMKTHTKKSSSEESSRSSDANPSSVTPSDTVRIFDPGVVTSAASSDVERLFDLGDVATPAGSNNTPPEFATGYATSSSKTITSCLWVEGKEFCIRTGAPIAGRSTRSGFSFFVSGFDSDNATRADGSRRAFISSNVLGVDVVRCDLAWEGCRQRRFWNCETLKNVGSD